MGIVISFRDMKKWYVTHHPGVQGSYFEKPHPKRKQLNMFTFLMRLQLINFSPRPSSEWVTKIIMLWTHQLKKSQGTLSAVAFYLSTYIPFFCLSTFIYSTHFQGIVYIIPAISSVASYGHLILKKAQPAPGSTNLRSEVVLLPHSWYSVPQLTYSICVGICLDFLICSPAPLKFGFELQQAVLELCCSWPRLDPFHQGQSHAFPTPGFLAEVYHKCFLSLEACEFILSELSVAPSSLPYYSYSNQKQVCSASLGSDMDSWSPPLGTNYTKELGIHTSAKPVCVAKASISHEQTPEEQCFVEQWLHLNKTWWKIGMGE